MANFPITRKPSPQYFSQTAYKAQVRSKFESGAVQSRPRMTSTKLKFSTGWDSLTDTEYASLVTFFNTYQGTTFNWTHPTTATVYVLRFSDDQLPKTKYIGRMNSENAWSVGPINLEQA